MNQSIKKFTGNLVLIASIAGIARPQPARGFVVAIPLAVAGANAFMVLLEGAAVITAGCGIGVLGREYWNKMVVPWYQPKSQSDTIAPPVVRPMVSARDHLKNLSVPKTVSHTGNASSSALNSDTEHVESEPTPSQDPQLEPPRKDFDFSGQSLMLAEFMRQMMNSREYEHRYDDSQRYKGTRDWKGYHPDLVKKHAKSIDEGKKLADQIREQIKEWIRQLPEFDFGKFKKQLEQIENLPRGISYETIQRDIESLQNEVDQGQFHNLIDKVHDLEEFVRSIEQIPEYKDLAKFWRKYLRENYTNEDGLLKDLPISRNPLVRVPNDSEVGTEAARNINHVQFVMKKIQGAWVYTMLSDQSIRKGDTPEAIARIELIADRIDQLKAMGDKLTKDWIRYGNGDSSVDSEKLKELVENFIGLGNALEKAKAPLEDDLTQFVKSNEAKVFDAKPVGENPGTLADQYMNWRKLLETFRRGANVTDSNWSFDGWSANLQPETREENDHRHDVNSKVEVSTSSEPTQKEDLEKFSEKYKGKIVRDDDGNLYLIEGIKTKSELNSKYKKSFKIVATGIVLLLKDLRIRMEYGQESNASSALRGKGLPPYQDEKPSLIFKSELGDVWVRVHGTLNQAGVWFMNPEDIAGLTAKEIQKKFSLPVVPTEVSDVHPPVGTTIRRGYVAANFDGDAGAIQYEFLDPPMAEWFSNRSSLK